MDSAILFTDTSDGRAEGKEDMREIPKPYQRYRHFKGNEYQVIAVAKDASEDDKQYVIYQALYGDYKIYARELNEFLSKTDKVKYPNATQEYRFEEIAESAPTQSMRAQTAPVQSVPVETAPTQSVPVETAPAQSTPAQSAPAQSTPVENEDECVLDPDVVRFLDAKNPEDKLEILSGLRSRITDDMLTIMAVSMDFELNEGSTEKKYGELKNALLMRDQFERSRLR